MEILDILEILDRLEILVRMEILDILEIFDSLENLDRPKLLDRLELIDRLEFLDKNLFPKHQRPNFAPQVFGLYLYYCNAGSDNHPFYNGIEIKVEHLT